MWIDPTGCVIKLTGDENNKNLMLGMLQIITDYTLDYGKDGNVFISSYGDKDSMKYIFGNILIYALVNSKHTVEIRINTSINGYHYLADDYFKVWLGWGCGGIITFNPNSALEIPTIDPNTGNVYMAETPGYIGLAHELIHAHRAMMGIAIDQKSVAEYKYQSGRVRKNIGSLSWWSPIYNTQKEVPKEELATIGLKYTNDMYWVSENAIRAEHGLPLRGAYRPV